MRQTRILLVLVLGALPGVLTAERAAAAAPNLAGQVAAVAGPVTVTRADASPFPLKFRDTLYWRDVVDARKNGIARLLLGGKTTVTIRELSTVELREDIQAEGIRYTVGLLSGKVRASVARMLMRPGEQVEVWTRNVSASVRGTDFIVETTSDPVTGSVETVVVTLSGVVDVSNRLAGTGRVEQVGPSQAVRVRGTQDPVRFQVSADAMKRFLEGLTPPRPQEARSADQTAVEAKLEGIALATSVEDIKASGPGRGQASVKSGNGLSGGVATSGAIPATPAVPAQPAVPGASGTIVAVPATPAIPAIPPSLAGPTAAGILTPLRKGTIQ